MPLIKERILLAVIGRGGGKPRQREKRIRMQIQARLSVYQPSGGGGKKEGKSKDTFFHGFLLHHENPFALLV